MADDLRDGFEKKSGELGLVSEVYIIGAGVSVPPPASVLSVRQFLQNFVETTLELTDLPSKLVERTIWGDDIYGAPRFEEVVNCISDVDESLRCLDFLRYEEASAPNRFHFWLADRIQSGSSVLTTNFDAFIEAAYWLRYGRNIDTAPGRLDKVHGSMQTVRDGVIIDQDRRNLKADIFSVARGNAVDGGTLVLDRLVSDIGGDRVSIWGYSFSDSFDVSPALAKAKPSEAYILAYSSALPDVVSKLSKDLRKKAGDVLRAWEVSGTSIIAMAGDLHGVLPNSKPCIRSLKILPPDRPIFTFADLSGDEIKFIVARICMNQDALDDANGIFESLLDAPTSTVRDLSLHHYVRTLEDWDLVLAQRCRILEAELPAYAELHSYITLLDAAAFLVDTNSFKQIYRDLQSCIRIRSDEIEPMRARLIRAKASHCLAIYFLMTGRPRLSEYAAATSRLTRERTGEPTDILYAHFAICMAVAYQGKVQSLKGLLVDLRVYGRKVGGPAAESVVAIAEGLLLLLLEKPLAAKERFDLALASYAVGEESEQRDPEVELYGVVAMMAADLNSDLVKARIDDISDYVMRRGYVGFKPVVQHIYRLFKYPANSTTPSNPLAVSYDMLLRRAQGRDILP